MTFNLFFCFPQVSWQIVSIPTSRPLFFLQWLFLQQQHYFLFLFATENQHSLRPFTVLILKNISTGQREKQASNNHFWIKTKNYHLETIIIIIIILQLFYFVFEANFQVQAPGGLIFGGAIYRRSFCITSLGGFYMEGLIFGILRY